MKKIDINSRSEKEKLLMSLPRGYYWFKVKDQNWEIGEWGKYDEPFYGGSLWTCGDECDIMIDEFWTFEMRNIEEIDERRITREEQPPYKDMMELFEKGLFGTKEEREQVLEYLKKASQ